MAKKEQLEESRAKLHNLMRESHITEQLQQKEQISQELTSHLDVELKSYQPTLFLTASTG